MPQRRCLTCSTLYDKDLAPGWRCPACQAARTTALQARPSSSDRGYDGEYQRNRDTLVATAIANQEPCIICHKPCLPGQQITAEHRKPLRDGGTSSMNNLAPAHSACNTAWNRKKPARTRRRRG